MLNYFFLFQIDTQDVDGPENGRPVCASAANKAAVCIQSCLFNTNVRLRIKHWPEKTHTAKACTSKKQTRLNSCSLTDHIWTIEKEGFKGT